MIGWLLKWCGVVLMTLAVLALASWFLLLGAAIAVLFLWLLLVVTG